MPAASTIDKSASISFEDVAAYCDEVERMKPEAPTLRPKYQYRWDYTVTNFRRGLLPPVGKCVSITGEPGRQRKRKKGVAARRALRMARRDRAGDGGSGVVLPAIMEGSRRSTGAPTPRKGSVSLPPAKTTKNVLSAFSAEISSKAVVGIVLQTADNERPSSRMKGGKGAKLPFGKDEYLRLRSCFEAIDKDGSGALDWEELQELGQLSGHVIGYDTFIRMDTDGSGTIDFIEMLKCMYPHCPQRSILHAAGRWGLPASVDVYREDEPAWKERFDNADEICDIFSSFQRPGNDYVTFADLRANLSQSVSNEWISSVIAEYGVDGIIRLEQVCGWCSV